MQEKGKTLTYRLVSATIYYGTGTAGHYMALEVDKSGKTYLYNDRSASTIDSNEIVDYLKHATMTAWELVDDPLSQK